MSQALPVDQPRWVDGKKVDCNGAPWIEAGIGMDVLPRIAPFDWREQMAKAKEIVKQAEDEEDEAVKGDDQSNETLNEEGELVEAPKNNEKPETNLKRKNAMVNGSTPKKSKQEKDVITTAITTAIKHVQKMKANIPEIVANIGGDEVAKNIEEMDKLINIIVKSDTPGMESVVNGLSLIWVHLREKLQ